MNEIIDLREILKDCPAGTKLYSSILGDVELLGIDDTKYPICVTSQAKAPYVRFSSSGTYLTDIDDNPIGECTLFPSRDQRDWSKFETPKEEVNFEPFQKVLVRDDESGRWTADFYSHYVKGEVYPYVCAGDIRRYCIPYEGNEHLLGTTNNPKE